VMDMSDAGASGESGWVGAIQFTQSSVPITRFLEVEDVECECTLPAITTRSMPAMMDPAPVSMAANPEAQCPF
jgi:hypothetical protein